MKWLRGENFTWGLIYVYCQHEGVTWSVKGDDVIDESSLMIDESIEEDEKLKEKMVKNFKMKGYDWMIINKWTKNLIIK